MAKVRSALGSVVDFEMLRLQQELTPIVVQSKVNIPTSEVLPVMTEEVVIQPAVTISEPVDSSKLRQNKTIEQKTEIKPEPKQEIKAETTEPVVELQIVEPTNETPKRSR